jgi:hypothetical protein
MPISNAPTPSGETDGRPTGDQPTRVSPQPFTAPVTSTDAAKHSMRIGFGAIKLPRVEFESTAWRNDRGYPVCPGHINEVCREWRTPTQCHSRSRQGRGNGINWKRNRKNTGNCIANVRSKTQKHGTVSELCYGDVSFSGAVAETFIRVRAGTSDQGNRMSALAFRL